MPEERKMIRVKLAEHNLTQVWLRGKLEDDGIITDKTELCSVLKGSRKGAKAEKIINKAIEIINEYEKERKNGC